MKKFKNQIALALYKMVLLLARSSSAKRSDKTLLLIKNDEIGDYILFRNFLKDIRHSEKYKNHKITLLGNIIWKQLFDEFDSKDVDEVIWMQKKKFQKELSYRYSLLKKVRKKGFAEVINCIYSRNILNDECFVSVISCKNKTGMANNSDGLVNSDGFYSQLVDVGRGIEFDIYKNEKLISYITGKAKNELHTSVLFDGVTSDKMDKAKKYCVIFAGAGKQDKLWPPEYFAEIITYIHKKYKLDIYLCGGPGDVKDSEAVKLLINIPVHDYTGKTTMPQSLNILKDAEFMLSVDTGSVHMGAGVQCPVIALYSGRDYGRFAPYPQAVFDKFYSIFSDNVDQLVKERPDELNDPNIFPFSEIRNIPPAKVMPYIELLITNA